MIGCEEAGTLDGLFLERVRRSGDRVAHRWFDPESESWQEHSWNTLAARVACWRAALKREALNPGDRVALILRNCPEWVCFDQAALALGLVSVPLYTDDQPENIAYILQDAGVRLLLVQDAGRWRHLEAAVRENRELQRVVILRSGEDHSSDDPRLCRADEWLPEQGERWGDRGGDPHDLASIVYTSGTTGRPKGVMLSHHNMLSVAQSGLQLVPLCPDDRFLSFLPLSHTLERTAGYYMLMMAGCEVAYARSVAQLGQDLVEIRPTAIISVPRVFERVYARVAQTLEQGSPIARGLFNLAVTLGWRRFEVEQGRASTTPLLLLQPLLDRLIGSRFRARLGGRLRAAVTGGAPLSAEIARVFIGLGVPILQGYGLTETAPVVSVNPERDNDPASVGLALDGVEVKVGEQDELLVKGPGVMLGYWNNPQATRSMIEPDGWLHTGDQARIAEGHIYITGRIKDILVLSNGEKVSPSDMEVAIALDPLIEQVAVVGEGRPYLAALVVLNRDLWPDFAREAGVDSVDPAALGERAVTTAVQRRIRKALEGFPGYAKVRRVWLTLEPWSLELGLLTPTLKIRKGRVLEHHAAEINGLYSEGPTAQ